MPQTPQAPIWISAALAGTAGLGTCRMTGGAPGPSNVATRMLVIVFPFLSEAARTDSR